MTRYPPVADGEATTINPQKVMLRLGCCDCKLVHRVEFVVGHRQKLTIRMWRDNRATAARRRKRRK